jgi:CsoR family transcriptional regulator, copper-sensing transcriptional repressor
MSKVLSEKKSAAPHLSCHGAGASAGPHQHPDHSAHLKRINRVKGQLEGIQNMIEERRYCPDIINQLKAAGAGIGAIEADIFKTHLRACVRDAFSSNDSLQVETKIEEIMKMVF